MRSIPSSLDYTLQFGSFSQMENARQLRDRLAKSFDEVTISPVNAKDATYYRVHLGSFTSRADAEQRARQISRAGYSVIIMEK
jgi:cell division protein FtsN